MNRAELEKYLGKSIGVRLFDGEVIKGCLRKTHDEMFKSDPNLYLPTNYYFFTSDVESTTCISCLFRTSHVMRLKEI